MITISRSYTFEAAHSLPKVPASHPCARLHGHSYRVEVFVSAETMDDCGMVVDYEVIDRAWAPLHEALDHRLLNEVPGLENSTVEILTPWIWDRLKVPGLSK